MKWTKESPRCRACASPKSERSSYFCDDHLAQATRWANERAASEKGNGKWSPVSTDALVGMRLMRARGFTLKRIGMTFGYTAVTVGRHVRNVKWERGRTGSGWR